MRCLHRGVYVLLSLFTLIMGGCRKSTEHLDNSLSVSDAPGPTNRRIASGIRVLEVDATSVLDRVGLRAGDVITAWSRKPATEEMGAVGEIADPFDWEWMVIEQAPRGTLELQGHRHGNPFTWTVPRGGWRAEVGPATPVAEARAVKEAESFLDSDVKNDDGKLEKGLQLWKELAESPSANIEPSLQSWLALQAGRRFLAAENIAEALTLFELSLARATSLKSQAIVKLAISQAHVAGLAREQAIKTLGNLVTELTRDSEPTLMLARARFELAKQIRRADRLDEAKALWHEVLVAQRKLAPQSLEVALTLSQLTELPTRLRDRPPLELGLEALSIQQELDPHGPEIHKTMINLGHVKLRRKELDEAADYYRRAAQHAISRKDRFGEMIAVFNFGTTVQERGRLREAEKHFRQTLEWFERERPNDPRIGYILNNLGRLSGLRGDFATARHRLFRALEIKRASDPRSLTVANTHTNLGQLAYFVGDLQKAKEHHTLAAELRESILPGSIETASSRIELAQIQIAEGDLNGAEQTLQSARSKAVDSPATRWWDAQIFYSFGRIAELRKKNVAAELLYLDVLEIYNNSEQKESLDAANVWQRLGSLALDDDRWGDAEERLRKALRIQENLAPGSADLVYTYSLLGRVERSRGNSEAALVFFLRAVETLDQQVGKIDDDIERRGAFRAKFVDVYQDLMALLIDLDREPEALEILERFKANRFLAMLSERDLDFSADVPEKLLDQRQDLATEIDRLQYQRSRMPEENDKAVRQRLEAELETLRQQRRAVELEISNTASARYQALQFSKPLDGAGIQESLDVGTVALSFFSGPDDTYLFVIDRESIVALILEQESKSIEGQVEQFRNAIEDYRNTELESFEDEVIGAAQDLFRSLLEPAWPHIDSADRIVIFPDGVLHHVPFAALAKPMEANAISAPRTWQYLVESKPLHIALSATVYDQLRYRRTGSETSREGSTGEVLAFGDPVYPIAKEPRATPDPHWSSALRDFDLRPLPGTRLEVQAIAALFGDRSQIFTGEQATEARAKAIGSGADVVHFAVHARWDQQFALDSALMLTIPERFDSGGENGLLQAWEIFEQVRLEADLVVLSACSTARGKLAGGEGLIGLTRAFQYAGARSVLATQWDVSDDPTMSLMQSFYTRLKSGLPKDEALRQAQMKLLQNPETAAPFYWAAFQLDGAWR